MQEELGIPGQAWKATMQPDLQEEQSPRLSLPCKVRQEKQSLAGWGEGRAGLAGLARLARLAEPCWHTKPPCKPCQEKSKAKQGDGRAGLVRIAGMAKNPGQKSQACKKSKLAGLQGKKS